MGAKRRPQGEGGATAYLKIVGGALWQTKNVSTDSPFYTEEEFTLNDGSVKTRKGYKFDSLNGIIQSGFLKETDYGTLFNLYIEDEGQLFCIGLKADGNWGAYSILKRILIGLMVADLDEQIEINVGSFTSDDGYEATVVWIVQDGKKLVLNPYADESKLDKSEKIFIPAKVKKQILSVPRIEKEESKTMTKKQKIRRREEELEALIELVTDKYLADKNEEVRQRLEEAKNKSEDATPPEDKTSKKKVKSKKEPEDDSIDKDDLPF